MTLVVDASLVVSALVDAGSVGSWAENTILSDDLAAPQLMPMEAANVLRRAVLAGDVGDDAASLAHADLLSLRVTLYPYELVAVRAWELRHNLTIYDASYVALAELLGSRVATLDARLARSPGPKCGFLVAP